MQNADHSASEMPTVVTEENVFVSTQDVNIHERALRFKIIGEKGENLKEVERVSRARVSVYGTAEGVRFCIRAATQASRDIAKKLCNDLMKKTIDNMKASVRSVDRTAPSAIQGGGW